jgi:hypothetical protein
VSSTLAARYGTGRTPTGRVFLGIFGVIIVALVAWTVWAVWVHSTPKVTSTLTTFTVQDATHVSVDLTVHLSKGAKHPSCDLKAYAVDHSTVGQLRFTPVSGRQSVTIRTYRIATSVDSVGCTADGQQDPQ